MRKRSTTLTLNVLAASPQAALVHGLHGLYGRFEFALMPGDEGSSQDGADETCIDWTQEL